MKKILAFILSVALFVIVIDIILLINKIPTISKTILYFTFEKNWQIFPYFMGVLIGHFFLPHKQLIKKLLLSIGLLLAVYIVLQLISSLIIFIHPIITVIIGTGAGTVFWAQDRNR
jgi:hypothetical protein